ncbi:MAG TPA: transcriptional regulator [Candidatus Limnocylindria bacterium]|nr:transcriptional regulator [Candidatus Limnocylindria bacterium]
MHDVDRVSLLSEPIRRQLYEFAAVADDAVDRDQAAAALGIGRPLAAFHLDRLVEGGLLEVEYRRRSGRSGPGAGRPAKFYRRPVGSQIDISLPVRRYALAAEILAEGLDRAAEPKTVASVQEAARTAGRRLAEDAPPAGTERDRLLGVLTANGFEPFEEDGVIRLRNCPFDALVSEHRDLTCGLNLALLESVAATLSGAHLAARRQSRRELCCVELAPAP